MQPLRDTLSLLDRRRFAEGSHVKLLQNLLSNIWAPQTTAQKANESPSVLGEHACHIGVDRSVDVVRFCLRVHGQ